MERYLCNICKSQLKIKHSDFLFKYNTECPNGHKNKNVLLKDYLINENIFKCQEHQKFNLLYCFTCQKEICLYCQNLHTTHKTEYLDAIKREELFNTECYKAIDNIIKTNKEFLIVLNTFEKKININLESLKTLLKQENDTLCHIIIDQSMRRVTFTDFENIRNLFKLKYLEKYINFYNKFNSLYTYLEKYEFLKSNFPNEIKELKEIIEPQKNEKIYQIIKDKLFPINNIYYIKIESGYKDTSIHIIKDISIDKNNFKYEKKFSKYFIGKIEVKGITLLDNINIEKKLSFFIITSSKIIQINITDINKNNNYNYNINEYYLFSNQFQFNEYSEIIGLIHLDINKNIIFPDSRISKVSIYNDLFDKNKEKVISENNKIINDYYKINENIFVFSISYKIIIISIDNENIINGEIKIQNTNITFLNFSQKEKILFCRGYSLVYLINFNTTNPEVFQIIDIEDCKNIKYHYYFFEEDSIYFTTIEKNLFYKIIYSIQYKIKDGKLTKISEIEIDKTNYYLSLKSLIN